MLRSFRAFALAGLACTTVLATPAFAVTFAGDYSISALNTDPGLVITTTKVGDLTSGFTLNNVGDSHSFTPLFKIGTTESAVNVEDDLVAYPISVAFSFTSPSAFGGSVTGDTVGVLSGLLGRVQNGLLTWDNGGIGTFNFGNGGQLQVALDNDVVFNKGQLWGTGDKQGKVGATFKLLSDSAPISAPGVPEPASWAMMIAGFGMIGGAMRSRRGKTSVSFA